MFRFEDPLYLYLLLLIPLLAVIRFVTYRNKKKRLRKFGDPKLLKELMPDVSRWRPGVKFWLLEAALALLILMLARPQMGTKISHEKRNGIETIICVDISNSMRAEDVSPSRRDRAKMMVENLVDHFTDDNTSDYVSAKMFLSAIDPSMMATQGTDIARAIEMATHSFTQEKGIGKAIIVITDGEDHEGGATEAAEAAKKADMRVYMLGIGSTQGAPIPIPGSNDYMIDNTGQTVMSALNEDMCKQIASAGGGAYIHVENNSNAQDLLDQELDKLSKKETQSTIYSDYDEQFQAFGILALLLLIIEICLLESKNPLMKRVSLFGARKKAAATMLLLLVAMNMSAQTDRLYIRQGNKQFRAADYANAEVSYRKALEKNDRNPQALYNLGNALLAQNKDSAAVAEFEKATKVETNELRKSKSFHNMGVICQRHEMYGEAIEAYKQSLRLNPSDDETRYNLELCKRQQKKQQQNQQNKDNKDKKDQQKQDQQKQDQQKQQQDKQQQQKQEPKMSKENAEQLLNAAMQQEKETQERMKKAQQRPQRRHIEKNW